VNGTLFFIFGSCLAALAGAVTFTGLRDSKAFASNAVSRALLLLFFVLVLTTATFAVLHSQDDQADRRAELAAEEAAGTQPAAAAPSAPVGGGETHRHAPKKQPAATGPGGTLKLAADPTQIAYDRKALSSKPGKVTIDFANPAPIQHDVAIAEGSRVLAKSKLIAQESTSVAVDLAPGKYVFYCTVPGHREAGMEGTLTVK
jgi:plastocyanin